MSDELHPVVKLQMLFRVPVEHVFEAFTNPEVTTQFWFTHSSGPLEAGKEVTWEWRMYGVSTRVQVLKLEPNHHILMRWGDEQRQSNVEWKFESRPDGSTLLEVINEGFAGTTKEIVEEAIDCSSGFSLVLANAKALLEHQVQLNLIADRFPDGHVEAE